MQVANLFEETAKLVVASMDGTVMDSGTYCWSRENLAADLLETAESANRLDGKYRTTTQGAKMLGGPTGLEQNLHPGMDDHNHMGHHRTQFPPKMEQYGDPYSFVDEPNNMGLPNSINCHLPPQAKKRGRRKKPDIIPERLEDFGAIVSRNPSIRENEPVAADPKERKRHDRFNGLTEEEVSQRTLPDHLAPNLDIVIIGINPGLFAAYKGHHYAGPGNHFWKCLYLSGLVPEPLTADDDGHLLRHGIGFTNMVSRPTKGSADLTRREIKQGCQVLLEKLQKYRPKVAVFNGKLIFEVFSGKKDFPFGRQREFVEGTNTYIWVMPSSSARCAQLPRAADKVPFYCALKKFLDYLNGLISEIDDSEIVFTDSKPIPKAVTNGDLKKPPVVESRPVFEENDMLGFPDSNVQNKKKRGRPRKGMEKNPPNPKKEKLVKKESPPEINGRKNCYDAMPPLDGFKRAENLVNRTMDIQRKRRGRPKKTKQEDGSPPPFSLGSRTTPDVLDGATGINNGTCQPPTASSVSSGYSTATSTDERNRREENGSLSNAGSSGPSPSHHSYTTQSDLSSEISAAISCGSAPPSPLNGHADSIFESLSGVLNQPREDIQGHQKLQGELSKMTMPPLQGNHHSQLGSNHCGPPMYMNSPVESNDPSFLPYHHHSYDNRISSFNHRNQLYHQTSSFRDGPAENGSTQNNPPYSNSAPFETVKSFDVASKSLSGLESLVDQIPSIADSEVGSAPPSASNSCIPGMLPEGISHGQSSHAPPTASLGHYPETSQSGFLSYGPPPSSYASASHYPSSPYYASELSSTFPVNSLGPAAAAAYCSPPTSSGMLLGYPGYHSQYGSHHGGSGYAHSSAAAAAAAAAAASLHLHSASSYGGPPGYPSSYSGPSGYSHGHSMSPSTSNPNAQRYPQRLHLRQESMDLSHMGFGGY